MYVDRQFLPWWRPSEGIRCRWCSYRLVFASSLSTVTSACSLSEPRPQALSPRARIIIARRLNPYRVQKVVRDNNACAERESLDEARVDLPVTLTQVGTSW